MNEIEVLDIGREALWTLVVIGTPAMMVALIVGLAIALFQALTQIQEMTLTFVPKIIAVFLSLVLFLPFMINTLVNYSNSLYERIGQIEQHDKDD
jgi:flagellar biosynthesis protein FliQ